MSNSKPKIRKWNDSYVQFGFTKSIRNDIDCAQCIHCAAIMANSSLRPSKLAHHRDTMHPERRGDSVSVVSAKRARFDRDATLPNFGFRAEEKPALQSSFEVAYQIAIQKKPHNIAETLIKPCTEKIVELMIGAEAVKKVRQVSLSNDTVRRRIDEMASDVCQQVCSEIRESRIQASLSLDESTDIL